ncbi:hypothetical protein P170DRAFT_178207 [Aspergillus steynii IBT 23096]|uniref:Uncharacterized protein n=1 Tax=Aspergillus steynii IBT 23096 TaxID=1392250 RepID=A0A2I2G8Q8_9EURO|nr:uncharacterized protein P170DRAFT_178207 [Aspergillus steynii IBT 23096]PLB49238.1 hypothetical protein P170DRAFT_178207 [Aspergillus steynii IBT 23096]
MDAEDGRPGSALPMDILAMVIFRCAVMPCRDSRVPEERVLLIPYSWTRSQVSREGSITPSRYRESTSGRTHGTGITGSLPLPALLPPRRSSFSLFLSISPSLGPSIPHPFNIYHPPKSNQSVPLPADRPSHRPQIRRILALLQTPSIPSILSPVPHFLLAKQGNLDLKSRCPTREAKPCSDRSIRLLIGPLSSISFFLSLRLGKNSETSALTRCKIARAAVFFAGSMPSGFPPYPVRS